MSLRDMHRTSTPTRTLAREALAEVGHEALGRDLDRPVRLPAGGPAGNARLTAWTGLVLLALICAQLLTLFDVSGLITWHVAIGALIGAAVLVKVSSAGWRMVRYYRGDEAYRRAGAPPLLLRLLAPLLVLATFALLGTGGTLVLIGRASARRELFGVFGYRVDAVTFHQAAFAGWCVLAGLHVLARLVPALRLTVLRLSAARDVAAVRVPGAGRRAAVLVVGAALGAALVWAGLHLDHSWLTPALRQQRSRPGG